MKHNIENELRIILLAAPWDEHFSKNDLVSNLFEVTMLVGTLRDSNFQSDDA